MIATTILVGQMLYHTISLVKVTMRKIELTLPVTTNTTNNDLVSPTLTAEQAAELRGLTKEYFVHTIGACLFMGTFIMAHISLFKDWIRLDEHNNVPIFVLIAGLYCCVTIVCSSRFISKNRLSNLGLLATALSGCYLVLSVVDHYSFFSPSDKAGVIFIEALDSANLAVKITDIQCNTVLFVKDEGEAMTWRCPTWFYGDPLSKWPFASLWSYKEGESRELKMAIEEIKSNAKKPPSFQ